MTTPSNPYSPKALIEALRYIEASFRVCFNDCSDSQRQMESAMDRFNGLVDDQISLGAFVRAYLLPDYVRGLYDFAQENDIDLATLADPPVSDLLIPFAEVCDIAPFGRDSAPPS